MRVSAARIVVLSKAWIALVALGAMLSATLLWEAGSRAQAAPRQAAGNGTHEAMAIGSAAPDFDLPGVDGRNHKLADYASARLFVIVFMANHSASSQLYEGRIRKLYEDYQGKGVAIVAVSPDDPKALRLDDLAYTDVGDTLNDMKVRADYRHIDWPYLYDGDKQMLSAKLGPSATPEVFVFDQARKLQYRGRIDDSLDEAQVKTRDARNAIEALLAGEAVPAPTTDAAGTAVRWSSADGDAKEELAKIEAETVSVAPASKADLTKLRANPTGKLLLVNFWATWCGPCVGEFPDLQATFRMYRGRDFAFETVSENDPDEKAGVLEFLQKQHASGPNLLFSDPDVYAMQAAFDPAMPGAVPFTVLIAPNGDVLYQQTGDLDILKVRRAILANLPDANGYAGLQKYWAEAN